MRAGVGKSIAPRFSIGLDAGGFRFALRLVCLAGAGVLSAQSVPSSSRESSQVHKRLNQLFYWQVADALTLSTEVEKAMVAEVEKQKKARDSLLAERDKLLRDLKKGEAVLGQKSVGELLASYRRVLDDLARIDVQEHDALLKILGASDLAKYYLVRDEFAQRLKQAVQKVPPK